MDPQPIIDYFRHLDRTRKLELLEQLWEEMSADPDAIPLTESQRKILEERLRQHEENPQDVHGWDEIKSEASRRFHGDS